MATYEPKYRNDVVRTDPTPVTISGKTIPGYISTFKDGTSKWIAQSDVGLSSNFDYSTLTGTKTSDGKWTWSGTTSNSIPNLASRNGLTTQQVNDALYKTSTLQNTLNGQRVNQLGGVQAAQKIDSSIPQSSGTSVNPNGPVDQGSAPVNLTDAANQVKSLKISDSDTTRTVNQYPNSENLRYPIDMNPAQQDCIKFTMLEYAPRSLDLQAISKGDPLSPREASKNRNRGSTVTLPIQPSITDSNTVNWNRDEMNAVDLIAASAALGTITGGATGAEEAIKGTASLLQGAGEDIKKTVAAGIAQRAAGTKGLLTRVTGGIVNPNMELLFNGPELRSFTFSFTMSAREAKESLVIRNIIRFFKQGMSVKRASTGLFLKSPHTFEIKYMSKNKEHQWINQIKECALTSCSVNYTSSGNYATYDDGAMTQYEMTLIFNELEPIYDDDYKNPSTTFETEIGY